MRLRKTMKRTAAAVLALSMAVSAVAAPASAAYICDVSQGSVEVSVNEKGEKTIKVGDDSVTIKTDGTKETTGNGIKEDGDGTDDIIITGDNTGDNTKPTDTNKSPKTFDAGIAMYVGMALTSVAGSAVVIGKKKEF